jgi:hypothetical protein
MIIGYQKANKEFGMQKVSRKGYLKQASAPSTKAFIKMVTISHEVSPNTISHSPHLCERLLLNFHPVGLSSSSTLMHGFYP